MLNSKISIKIKSFIESKILQYWKKKSNQQPVRFEPRTSGLAGQCANHYTTKSLLEVLTTN